MIVPQNEVDLLAMIQNQVEENHQLEYKSAAALDNTDGKKKDIAKDVSALANSAGGVIIYGIAEFNEKEKRHLPEKVDPIDRRIMSKEQLEHIVQQNISPRIEGLRIHTIALNNPEGVAYVVEVPKGKTAHQNTRDFRYYRRHNFEATPMLDDEIRDVMNRITHPILKLEIDVISEFNEQQNRNIYFVRFQPRNEGVVYAKYVNYYIEINEELLDAAEINDLKRTRNDNHGDEYVEFYGENTVRDVIDHEHTAVGLRPKLGPSRFDPILPGMHGRSEKLKIQLDSNQMAFMRGFRDTVISWRIYADNAPEQRGSIKLGDLESFKKIARI